MLLTRATRLQLLKEGISSCIIAKALISAGLDFAISSSGYAVEGKENKSPMGKSVFLPTYFSPFYARHGRSHRKSRLLNKELRAFFSRALLK